MWSRSAVELVSGRLSYCMPQDRLKPTALPEQTTIYPWSQNPTRKALMRLAVGHDPDVLLHGCSNDREHGGRLPRLQSIQNRSR
jgi:hypothetical protein